MIDWEAKLRRLNENVGLKNCTGRKKPSQINLCMVCTGAGYSPCLRERPDLPEIKSNDSCQA